MSTPPPPDEPERPRPGRPPLTDRAAILGAARELGFRNLTVGGVMSQVGRQYSTFYRHFVKLDELHRALAVDVLDSVPWPDPGPWRPHLAALGEALADVVVTWPGLTDTLAAMDAEPDSMAGARGRATELLRAAGFDPADATGGVGAVMFAATGNPGSARTDAAAREDMTTRVGLALDGLEKRHPNGGTT